MVTVMGFEDLVDIVVGDFIYSFIFILLKK